MLSVVLWSYKVNLIIGIFYLTLNTYFEARSEEQLGQISVAHVVLNRAEQQNKTVKEVVLEPYQFSWTNSEPKKIDDPKALLQCFASSVIALQGYDFTQGSTYYHHKRIKPYWRKGLVLVADIGNHKFYKSSY